MNINIFLRQFKKENDSILSMVRNGEFIQIGEEKLKGLQSLLPTDHEVRFIGLSSTIFFFNEQFIFYICCILEIVYCFVSITLFLFNYVGNRNFKVYKGIFDSMCNANVL